MTVAVLVAMGMEAARLIQRIEGAQPETKSGKQFLQGKIGEADVVLHRCGWGMRNSANGTRALIENYRPDVIVNYGVSGGLVHEIELGETVVALSSYPASGKEHRAGAAAEATDANLAEFAIQTLGGEARKSPIATSLGLIIRKKRNERIVAASGAVCIDMETYTAAKTARELGVPLLVIRCISDTLKRSSLLLFFKNGALAAEKAAAATESVIKALAEERNPL